MAQEAAKEVSFAVPAGPLGQALVVWGRQAGVQISYLDAATSGKSTSGLTGALPPEQALSRLLSGSGLSYSFSDARSVVIFGRSAEETGADPASGVNLGTIVLGGGALGSHDATFETAGSVAYVSGEEVAQKRGTSVGDFISGLPGVLNGDSRNSGALDVNIRGMQGEGRVAVVIDGASNQQTVYRGYNGARSSSYVDPDFIGEVAVEKGASTGADASGAIGGIVRMRTLSVHDILLPGKKLGFRVRAGVNSNSTSAPAVQTPGGVAGGLFPIGQPANVRDGGNMNRPGFLEPTGGNASIAAAFTSKNVDLVASVARRVNGNYFSGEHGRGQASLVDLGDNGYGSNVIGYEGLSPWKGGEEILNTSNENTSVLLKGNFRIGTDHEIELSYMGYDSSYGEIMPTRLGTHTSAVGGYQSPLDELDLKTYTLRYKWNPDSDLINLKVDTFRTDLDHRPTSLTTVGGVTTPSYVWSRVVRDGITISNESLIAALPGEFRLTYGGAWQREKMGLPDGLENDRAFTDRMEFPPRMGKRTETNAFLNADWQINPEWQVMAGLRYADYKTTDRNYKMVWDGVSYWPNMSFFLRPGDTTNISGHGLSKSIAVSWTPTETLQLYARYSDAYRMPSIFETINGFSTGSVPADLRPENAKSLELGVNKAFAGVLAEDDALRLHFAYYDNDIDDYVTRSDRPVEIFPGVYQGQLGMLNLENARMKGIELAADYARGDFSARLSWNHAITSRYCARPGTVWNQDLCNGGGFVNSYALQHVPPQDQVTLQLGYTLLDDRLNIGTRISYFSKRIVETTVANTSQIQPGKWNPYTLVDVYATYRIDEAKQIDFAIDNLTDRYYMDALNAALMPAPGRTFRVNFTTKF
ncbi:TonB-dependent receptor [Xinfangfangia sp. D13-10-4-6]|uniref:TonB-dependent receptor n=1 Tax=Pseudogemmobacter hezensis TaxID=2737662 RepID=UPI001554CC35|nr:TonB-dependent receptor [Pseudogemmobacter hezensis]NPD17299.1 TonB-dependent receptor [Pseudogemmobacter hezensis]